MIDLRMPDLRATPFQLLRSSLTMLKGPGATVSAREPIATCYLRLYQVGEGDAGTPFAEEQCDLQLVLAPSAPGRIAPRGALSHGGFQDLVPSNRWDEREIVTTIDAPGDVELVSLVLAGRRGFELGEARGGLLPGWHDRARAFWEGPGSGPCGTVLSYGTCEQTSAFRGEDAAFLSWFARAPGPAQVIAVADECTVHSTAVALQHLRRTPAEAREITQTIEAWIAERMGASGERDYPGFLGEASRGTLAGRWPPAQDVLFAVHLLAETVSTSPILQRTQLLTRRGLAEQRPPDAIAMSLASELAPHFRHRRTGWIVAIHGFRFGQYLGPAVADWLRRDFEPLPRTAADIERDLLALADEVTARTGACLLVQNLIASSMGERVPNYAWLGDAFPTSVSVRGNEANLMLSGATRHPAISAIDSDAMAARLGVRHCPDLLHAGRELVEAQRDELQRVLRERAVPGF
jgi:hypothetical protein